jgi:hypothetical protein
MSMYWRLDNILRLSERILNLFALKRQGKSYCQLVDTDFHIGDMDSKYKNVTLPNGRDI